jgi:HPt (histidine-containing phosphotransfer) domain-containing protein
MTTAMSWSPEIMIERIGGDEELARQLVTLFVEECPRMMAELRDSLATGEVDPVRRAAHAFKGSVSNFIDDGPAATALELETLARENRLGDTTDLLARLETEVAYLLECMDAFLKAGA